VLLRDRRAGRIAQNLGGIANLTAIPANAKPEDVIAFDTGPGNMVMDQLMQLLLHRSYDRNGDIARRGNVLQPVLKEALRNPFFRQKPPKTAGREEFGREYANRFLARCGKARKEDIIATATALTVGSIAEALKKFVISKNKYRDYIISGGGADNRTLIAMLTAEVSNLGLKLSRIDNFGIPSQAKEALAFAVLAYQTWHRQPSNIPPATGASRPAVLGKITYV
jgi:anhydro-N-acetylmuramic acid kinase